MLNVTRREPCDESTHGPCRPLARDLSTSKDLVHGVWLKIRVWPDRLERHMVAKTADFEQKAADIKRRPSPEAHP